MAVKDTLLAVSGLLSGNSGGGGSTLITKTITENGTYAASSDNADGYSEVTVNVEPQYGFVDAAYVDDTWQGSVSSNVFTLTYPISTYRYFLFKKPIVLQPEDVLKVECKKVSGTSTFMDLKISTIPYGIVDVELNFGIYSTVHASVYTNQYAFPLTVIGMGYCTRSAGSTSNLKLQVRVSLNDVVLFSSIT